MFVDVCEGCVELMYGEWVDVFWFDCVVYGDGCVIFGGEDLYVWVDVFFGFGDLGIVVDLDYCWEGVGCGGWVEDVYCGVCVVVVVGDVFLYVEFCFGYVFVYFGGGFVVVFGEYGMDYYCGGLWCE